jgi:hypothetical protein
MRVISAGPTILKFGSVGRSTQSCPFTGIGSTFTGIGSIRHTWNCGCVHRNLVRVSDRRSRPRNDWLAAVLEALAECSCQSV